MTTYKRNVILTLILFVVGFCLFGVISNPHLKRTSNVFTISEQRELFHNTVISTHQLTEKPLTISSDRKGCNNTVIQNDIFVPIFVLCRDRINDLQETLSSFQETLTASPYEIIILDHSSTYPPMVEYLNQLEEDDNITVYHLQRQNNTIPGDKRFRGYWLDTLREAADIIDQYLQENTHIDFYIFTDQDIALKRTAPDILLYYAAILTSCPDVKVIGPALQISDIPDNYNNKKKVLDWEKKYWTSDIPNIATWNGLGYHFVESAIDTTFAMRRRTHRFNRLTTPSIRTFAPYSAVHLDWYHDGQTEDIIWYKKHQNGVNHWR